MKYIVRMSEPDYQPGGYMATEVVYAESVEAAAKKAVALMRSVYSRPYWPKGVPLLVWAVGEVDE